MDEGVFGRRHRLVKQVTGPRGTVNQHNVLAFFEPFEEGVVEFVGNREGGFRIEDNVFIKVIGLHIRCCIELYRLGNCGECPKLPGVGNGAAVGEIERTLKGELGCGVERGKLELEAADLVEAGFEGINVGELATADGLVACGELVGEVGACRGCDHVLRKEHGDLYGLAEGVDLLREAGKHDGVGIELTELLGADAVWIVEAIDNAVGVLVLIGVGKLKHMEAGKKVACADALECVLPSAELEVLGDLESLGEVVLIALCLEELDLLVYPPGCGAAVALELFLKGVEIAPGRVVADLVRDEGTGELDAAADLATVGLVNDHRTVTDGAEAEKVVGIGEHISVFAVGEIVTHMLNVEVDGVTVKLAVGAGVNEESCGVVALDDVAYLSDSRIVAGAADLVTYAVDHKRGVVIKTVDDLYKLIVAYEILFTVEHFGEVVIVVVLLTHLHMHHHTAVVSGTEALVGRDYRVEADGVVAVHFCHREVLFIELVLGEITVVLMLVSGGATNVGAHIEGIAVEVYVLLVGAEESEAKAVGKLLALAVLITNVYKKCVEIGAFCTPGLCIKCGGKCRPV